MAYNIKSFFLKSKRVWHVLKKPSKEEYWTVAKVSAVGVLAIGLIGFIISTIVRSFLPK